MRTEREVWERIGETKGRLASAKELNEFLIQQTKRWPCRLFGIVNWWSVNALLGRWISENGKLITRQDKRT